MTLADAIEIVEQMTRSYAGIVREIVVGSGDSPTEIDARVKALRIVLEAAKRIDPCCESHSGDTRCRHCYEL